VDLTHKENKMDQFDEELPPEPGTVTQTDHGLTNLDAGSPKEEPPEEDSDLGDREETEGDGDDIDEED
jgi:hypothetical protein